MDFNCFVCYLSKHLIRNYLKRIIKDEIMIKEFLTDRETFNSYNFDSKN